MIIRTFWTCCLFLILASCDQNRQVSITNVSRDTVIAIQSGKEKPTLAKLVVQGKIDDTVFVNHMSLLPGAVDTVLQFDWYSPTLVIKYEAKEAKEGKLEVKVQM